MVQNIRENEKQSDGSYITKHRETNAKIVLYNTGEMNEDGSPVQTNVQKEIDDLKNSTSNIPNVGTNDQTPTYTESGILVKLTSGEKLSVAFGKISKAITDLITHLADNVRHITSTERSNWNAAKTHADSAHAPSNAQANVIETVKVNGTALTPSSKAVDIIVPTKVSELTNDSGFKTTDNNTTYSLSKSGSTITLTGSDGSTTTVTDSNTTYNTATTSSSGLMSSDDKTKLDGIESGANKTVVDSSLSSSSTNPVQNKVINSALMGKVPTSRTVNGKALSANITLSASDVGADVSGSASSALNSAKSYTDTKIANLVGTAPETMDTLEEVAAAIESHQDITDALNASIGNKVDKVSGKGLSTNDLTNTLKSNYDTAYTHSQATHARTDATKVEKSFTNGNVKINGTETTVYTHPSGTNPHGTTKSDVGLGNVGNFKAVSTVANQGLTDTEKSNARANIGAGTSSFSGSYNDLTNKPTIPTVGNGTITITQNGTTKGTFTTNQSGHTTIALTDNNTTYGVATQSANGLESAADKKKLDGIATGAEVNQNAFSNVVVGSTTISADSKTDSLTLAGSNVTITTDADNDKVTIGITKANVTSALGYTPPTTDTNTWRGIQNNLTSDSTTDSLSAAQGKVLKGLVDGKAASSHGNHVPATETANNAKFLRNDNTWQTVTPANIGAAASSHTHSAATTSANGLMSSSDKSKLDGIASGANNYSLPTASSSTLGGVKTTSTVTSTSGLTACPIINGVPYYKEGTGGSGEGGITTSNSVLIPVDYTLFTLNEETQRYEQVIIVDGMTEGNGGTFDILRSGAVLTEQESLIIANITDIVRQDGSIKVICLEQPTANYTLVLYGTFTQATDETTLIANMNGWFTRVENLESEVESLNNKMVKYNSETDKLDVYIEGIVVGSIPCHFKEFYLFKSGIGLTTSTHYVNSYTTETVTGSEIKLVSSANQAIVIGFSDDLSRFQGMGKKVYITVKSSVNVAENNCYIVTNNVYTAIPSNIYGKSYFTGGITTISKTFELDLDIAFGGKSDNKYLLIWVYPSTNFTLYITDIHIA